MSLRLLISNHLESLADGLAENLRKPLSSPFNAEVILIQSRGMERWISLQLATRLSICANIRFPFPNSFVYEVMHNVLLPEQEKERSPFEPEILLWRIMGLLPGFLDRPAFRHLRDYLDDLNGVKLLQLSARVADLFDQYLLYRPEMIARWEQGQEEHWQAELWREIVAGIEIKHRAALAGDLMQALKKPDFEPAGLPERISVFGISALPRFHMQVLAALSAFIDINLYLMNPCQEYWGDIVSESDIRRAQRKRKRNDSNLELFHLEQGNALLASMGKLGRDFFDMLLDYDYAFAERFIEERERTLLSTIQSDILNLRDRGLRSEERKQISPADVSLQFHSCHSPRREVEVLQDHLLSIFENNPELKPGDILVMAPDIEPYAPYIQAVLDLPRDDERHIPFSIADRSFSRESAAVETFLAILDLESSRFGAPDVLTILETKAVLRRFSLSENDLDLIQHWVRETNIRWGKDADDRTKLGLPSLRQNTWRAGLERLLLGYALPGDEKNMFADILPFDDVEGSQAEVLGKLLEFIERLFDTTRQLAAPRTLIEWQEALTDLLERFFASEGEHFYDTQAIRRTLSELDTMQTLAGFGDRLELSVIRDYLYNRLHTEGTGFGFLTGGVTFCSMLPMRSIPARVICLIGMNSDAYPRNQRQLGFDLIAQYPERGDRSRRNDDRYLFLETVLSAREVLYISYVGQSIKDNTPIPPSVLVSELLDYVQANFELEQKNPTEALVTKHRLQAFSPEYFEPENRLFSYSKENLEAAKQLMTGRNQHRTFIESDLPEPDDSFREIELMDFYRFLRNPVRFLLNKRLGLYLQEEVDLIDNKEPFELTGLEKYKVAEEMVSRAMAGEDIAEIKKVRTAAGVLPLAAVGEHEFQTLRQRVELFAEKTRARLAHGKLPDLEVDLHIDDFHIGGTIDTVFRDALAIYRFARIRAKDRLRAWLYHLILNCHHTSDYPRRTILIGVDRHDNWSCLQYEAPDDPEGELRRLLSLYWEGLQRPLRFFPDSALEYIESLKKKPKAPGTAKNKAWNTWNGSGDFGRGESADPHLQLCFGTLDTIVDDEFVRLANEVYQPILRHARVVSS